MHDFLDNLANDQYQKTSKPPVSKSKITPQTYIDMNKEFEEEGTPFRIIVPTQEQIDNAMGVKIPEKFEPQPPMTTDGTDPWPHSNNQ